MEKLNDFYLTTMEQETSILRYTELTAILHSTSKKELTEIRDKLAVKKSHHSRASKIVYSDLSEHSFSINLKRALFVHPDTRDKLRG